MREGAGLFLRSVGAQADIFLSEANLIFNV